MEDRTEELPIFQQVNNWFQPERVDLLNGVGWISPADEGWKAASESARYEPVATTKKGLPVRIPQRNLVPGAVQTLAGQQHPQPASDQRDPTQVAAAMAAYARGVATRRLRLAKAFGPGRDASRKQAPAVNTPMTNPQGSTP
jgi:hypothetical protein